MAFLIWRNFKLPSNFLRILELICCLLAFCLVAGWESAGLTYHNLDKGDVNAHNSFSFYLAIAVISFLIFIAYCGIILLDWRIVTPLMDMLLSGCLALFWFISTVILTIRVDEISQTDAVREAALTFKSIQGSLAMGFCCVVFLFGSSWFALCNYRKTREFVTDQSQTHMVAELPQDIIT
ncbi:hypothetical protein ScPMuIL_006796 [Solemya velum]